MNFWFPFCKKDRDRALEWLRYAGELGLHQHSIYLHPAMELKGEIAELIDAAKSAFKTVEIEPDREGHVGWPMGPNSAFRQAAWFFYAKQQDWSFLENDCWPTTYDTSWADKIETEWQKVKASGKFFMGDLVPAGNGYGEHMSGNGGYTYRMPEFSDKMMRAEHAAFDIVDPAPIVNNMVRTPLIQDTFCHPPTIVPTFRDFESLSLIRSSTVLFHRNKDLTLCRRLRERRNGPARAVQNEKIVYAYYDPALPNQEWMIQKWTAEWLNAGFIPKVIGVSEAMTHPHFEKFEAYFKSLPTINPPAYELACWRRWIAMVQVGGGLMTDYDVLPYSLNLGMVPEYKTDSLPLIMADNNPCPCAVIGTANQFNNALKWFMANSDKCIKTENGRPHASDQTAVQSGVPWVAIDLCFQYGREGWEKSPMVHYCHAACAGRPRRDVIPEAEKMRSESKPWPATAVPVHDEFPITPHKPTDPVHVEAPAKQTWIDGVRSAVKHLLEESKISDNNRTRIMKELKGAGLTPGGIKYAPERMKKVQIGKKREAASV